MDGQLTAGPSEAHTRLGCLVSRITCATATHTKARDLPETSGGCVSVSAPFTPATARGCIRQPCQGDRQSTEAFLSAHFDSSRPRPAPMACCARGAQVNMSRGWWLACPKQTVPGSGISSSLLKRRMTWLSRSNHAHHAFHSIASHLALTLQTPESSSAGCFPSLVIHPLPCSIS